MKIQLKELMDSNEMLSHIFLECMPHEDLMIIRDQRAEGVDWRKESVTIPVEMSIGGIPVNPKAFFDNWRSQMKRLIEEKAVELVAEKTGSGRVLAIQERLQEFEQIVESWESEINWDANNPFV